MNRNLVLNTDVNEETAKEIIQAILDINAYDLKQEAKDTEYEREPIKLHINSMGGDVLDGIAIISAMDCSKTPVYTIVLGSAYSTALFVTVAGHQRFAYKYANFMYHEVSDYYASDTQIKLAEQKETIKFNEDLMKVLDGIVIERTNITATELHHWSGRDWYFNSAEALRLGVIDSYLKPRRGIKKK